MNKRAREPVKIECLLTDNKYLLKVLFRHGFSILCFFFRRPFTSLFLIGLIGITIAPPLDKMREKQTIQKPQKKKLSDAQIERNWINALLKSSPEQRDLAYKKLAYQSGCFIHNKPGSALLFERCMNKQYNYNKIKYEAEIRMAKGL